MTILVDPKYNPNFMTPEDINSGTKLSSGVTIAKFLGAYGDRTPFNHVGIAADRQQIARQLYLHAELIRTISANTSHFNDIRLIVSEGIYKGGPSETIAGDNLKKSDGRTVVYQVIDRKGIISNEKTFDVAEYWKDYVTYEKITLDYDTYAPSKILTASIMVEMPPVDSTFNPTFGYNLGTQMNGVSVSENELIEILAE
jgi:hypothetical protein